LELYESGTQYVAANVAWLRTCGEGGKTGKTGPNRSTSPTSDAI